MKRRCKAQQALQSFGYQGIACSLSKQDSPAFLNSLLCIEILQAYRPGLQAYSLQAYSLRLTGFMVRTQTDTDNKHK